MSKPPGWVQSPRGFPFGPNVRYSGRVGPIVECSAAPSFAELVMADVIGLVMTGGTWVLFVVLVYVHREKVRKWLGH